MAAGGAGPPGPLRVSRWQVGGGGEADSIHYLTGGPRGLAGPRGARGAGLRRAAKFQHHQAGHSAELATGLEGVCPRGPWGEAWAAEGTPGPLGPEAVAEGTGGAVVSPSHRLSGPRPLRMVSAVPDGCKDKQQEETDTAQKSVLLVKRVRALSLGPVPGASLSAGGGQGPPAGSPRPVGTDDPAATVPGDRCPRPHVAAPRQRTMCLGPENPEGADGEVGGPWGSSERRGAGPASPAPGTSPSRQPRPRGLSPSHSARPESVLSGTRVLVRNFREPPGKPPPTW